MRRVCAVALPLLLVACPALAQNRAEDEYTRYELLAPETNSFRIVYDVSAVTPGAKYYFSPIRKGSQARDGSVIDLMTGAPLTFKEVSGRDARAAGLTDADPDARFLQVALARPVPNGGQSRIRILKTYKDAASYFREGDAVVFKRSLSIRRNAVVLPNAFELIGANVPVQVIQERDGRIAASFMHLYAGDVPLVIRARPLTKRPVAVEAGDVPCCAPGAPPPPDAPSAPQALDQIRVSERAIQDREIVYFLKQPETHAFSLYHDYTASREGEHQYVNVVRAGSKVSDPSAMILDTGEALKTGRCAPTSRASTSIPDRQPAPRWS
jgi:hypothetical protein